LDKRELRISRIYDQLGDFLPPKLPGHFPSSPAFGYNRMVTHAQLVEKAVAWLRHYRCGVVLSEQACVSGEMPDAIGWKRACHSVVVECKISRADFLADRAKPWRRKPEGAVG
jgi:hypothetical protein